jgi:glycosyltransferase involved in cell wall biosynthesis
VLDALHTQTLSTDKWELLVIDNASDRVLAREWDLSWHAQARHIREDELGLTPARLRGIAEAQGALLVFVDDDNVLNANYLENALAIARKHPFLGAWGGTIRGEFESEPAMWARAFFTREYRKPSWSNLEDDWRVLPCGAGLCVRACIAKKYAARVRAEPARRQLGRIGLKLMSCEDDDLVGTSCEFGLGYGGFPDLELAHLIPAARLRRDYLFCLRRGQVSSQVLLHYLRSGVLPAAPNHLKIALRYLVTLLRQGGDQAQLYLAAQQGVRAGIRTARALPRSALGAGGIASGEQ